MKKRVVCAVGAVVFYCVNSFGIALYSGGSGTAVDPYQISSKADLLLLASRTGDYGKYFILTADIDLIGESFDRALIAPDTDMTNGTFDGVSFTGNFNGNGHIINHLTINTGAAKGSFLGLFGQLYYGADAGVTRLGLENVSITSPATDGHYTGALCGLNAYVPVSYCFARGTVTGYDRVGGLIGHLQDAVVNNSYASVHLTGHNYVGGLCGYVVYSMARVINCFAGGDVNGNQYVGGFFGCSVGSTVNCYSVGAVNGVADVGGFCGCNSLISTGCFWCTETSGQSTSPGGAVGKTMAELQTVSTFTDAGWDFTYTWHMYGTPTLYMAPPVSYNLEVRNGDGDGQYWSPTNVVITALTPKKGTVFDKWIVTPPEYTGNLANQLASSTTFTMPPTNVTVVATYVSDGSDPNGGCGDPPEQEQYCAIVYSVKVSLKTTNAKFKSGYADECGDTMEGVCYRDTNGRLNLIGYAYSCDCNCAAFMNAYITVWDRKTKEYFFYDDELSWLFLNIIGKKANKVEGSWTADAGVAVLQGSGFGTFDVKRNLVKSISGYTTGWGYGPSCLDVDCSDYTSGGFNCDDLFSDEWGVQLPTVYYGSWYMRYNSSYSNKQAQDEYFIYSKFPEFLR